MIPWRDATVKVCWWVRDWASMRKRDVVALWPLEATGYREVAAQLCETRRARRKGTRLAILKCFILIRKEELWKIPQKNQNVVLPSELKDPNRPEPVLKLLSFLRALTLSIYV